MELLEKIIFAVLTMLGSGAVLTFVQFMITRKDKNREADKETDKKLDEMLEKTEADKQEILNAVGRVSDKVDYNAAVLARTHILRFSDEIRNHVEHSSEYWRQTLDDCDTYARFCETHPEFRNSYTTLADKYIKETYEKLTREGKL